MSTALYLDRHGVKVGSSGGRLTLRGHDGEEWSLPVGQIDHVIVMGHTHFSHDAIATFLREDIPVVFSSLRGGLRGCLTRTGSSRFDRRGSQYDASRDPDARLLLSKTLIQAKIRGQARLLRQWRLDPSPSIVQSLIASRQCKTLESLRGLEGTAARAFFSGMREHLSSTAFVFDRRLYHPPPDPVNALLSLCYTLLLNEVSVGATAAGLDHTAGFFHSSADARPALLMDLIEPLRPLADRLAVRLLRSSLTPDDFETNQGMCVMRDGRRGFVYKEWEHLLGGTVTWRNEQTTWRRLIHLQAREVARWLDGSITRPGFWHLDAR